MSIKKNFIYSFILVFSGYVFPLITYPYISRVLGVSNIGICNFVDSIINYFLIFSSLGLTTIGIREVAKHKADKKKLNTTFSSIIALNFIFTISAISILVLLMFYNKQLSNYKELLFIGIFKILFNLFLIEWFYRGIENFKYITIRSILVQAVYIISLFIFVKNQNDYNVYYLLTTLIIVVNSLINWQYRKSYVKFYFKDIRFKPILKSTLTLGSYRILTSMYTTFNVAYLGFVAGNTEVGYYTTSTKLYTILIAAFASFTSVMLPRMSSLVGEGRFEDLKTYTSKSFDILYSFSFPIIFFSIVLAPQIIYVLSGKGYEGAILPFIIIMPLILIIGLEQVLIIQILTPMRKDNAILINSIIGASLGLLLNFSLVGKYHSVGTAIVWIASEFGVFISALFFVNKYLNIKLSITKIVKSIIVSLPIIVIAYIVQIMIYNPFVVLFVAGLISIIYVYIIQTFLLKNEFLLEINQRIRFILKI